MKRSKEKNGRTELDLLFNPKAIALVGSSPDTTKFQGKILKYLLKHGYNGQIYPVNPSYESVLGQACYPSLSHITAKFDLVIVVVRSEKVLGILEEAVILGCPAAIVIGSDFAESGEVGRKRQEQLTAFSHASGLRILGPNCLGYINIPGKIAASGCTSLEKETLLKGKIGLVTQSGALMGSIYGRAQDEGIGYNLVVSMGNEADIEASQVIRYMLNDPNIEVVTGFIETFRDLDNLLDVADLALDLKKPLVVLKVGQSEQGRQAAASHTAAIAGSNDVANALFRKKGIIRVDTVDQLYRTANLLTQVPKASGNRVGIFTISGGACGWLADRCQALEISVPDLSPRTKKRLEEVFQYGHPTNPLDITGQAISNQAYFSELLEIFIEDENLDIILIGMTAMPFPKRAAEDLVKAARTCRKPFIVFWTFDHVGEEAYAHLRQANVPLFHSSEACLKGIKHLIEYSKFQREHGERSRVARYTAGKNRKLQASQYLAERTGILTEYESKVLLDIYGIPITKEKLVGSIDEALEAAEEIGYPVAIKLMSPSIVHKTDVGAIRIHLHQTAELKLAYKEIMDAGIKAVGKSKIDGVLVQEMVVGEAEVFTGLINDRIFGTGVLFGIGGVMVELLEDKVVGIPPLSHVKARSMIVDSRVGMILQGYRGQAVCDIEAIARLLVQVGEIGLDLRDYIDEIDLNPVMVFAKGCGIKVVDATITLHNRTSLENRKEEGNE